MRIARLAKLSRQPAQALPLSKTASLNPLIAYNGAVGAVDVVSGRQFTRGSAFAVASNLSGVGARQTAVNTGLSLTALLVPSLASYVAVWSGVFLGAISGSTPKLIGISNTSSSQSQDVIGLEFGSATDFVITFKSAGVNSNRTFANSVPALNVPVTLVAVYDSGAAECRLHVCANGFVTSYSSAVASAAAPTILGTEVYCVGPDVVEAPSRYINAVTALGAVVQSVGGAAAEREIARNPWQLFQARPPLYLAVAAGGSSDTPVNPGVGSLTLTGYAPTVAQTANQAVAPGVGSLTITGYAPTVARTDNQAIAPGAGSLSITGYAPTVAQTTQQEVLPGVGSLVFTGYAPSVTQGIPTAANENVSTVMRASVTNASTAALVSSVAAQAAVVGSINLATVIRSTAVASTGTMRDTATNLTAGML